MKLITKSKGKTMTLPSPLYWYLKEFNELFNFKTRDINSPCHLPDNDARGLRVDLLLEEFEEYINAENKNDIVEIADALGDMMYIIMGTAVEYGIHLDAVLKEIHRSNMSKVGSSGKPIFREDGKLLKPESYSPPDIKKVM